MTPDCRPPAGYVTVPAEMTEAQAVASLAGSAVAQRVREKNPETFEKLVEVRRATWRHWSL